MRAVLDTDAFVRYLLSSRYPPHDVQVVVDAALAGAYDLQLPDGPLDELIGSVENKPEASRLIDLDDARHLAAARCSCVELRPSPTPHSPHVTRDIDV